jgi:hypothetical protein
MCTHCEDVVFGPERHEQTPGQRSPRQVERLLTETQNQTARLLFPIVGRQVANITSHKIWQSMIVNLDPRRSVLFADPRP